MGNMSSEALLKKLYVELLDTRKELNAMKANHGLEMAVVGAACRFPGGVDSLESFWDLLCSGRDPIGPVPASRWNHADYFDASPDAPGKAYARESGFVGDVSQFDAGFFDISPREAAEMDPQQRMLLELSWETFHHAGQDLLAMKGSHTGVFVGMSTDDYAGLTVQSGDHSQIDAYNSLGTARSVAAGRVAYTWGFHGPVIQLDTACSSSLAALHLACQSIASGDCEQALVAGINLMLAPELHIACSRLRALSPTGRCKVFDDSADGYVRSEGAGCVLVKPLARALEDGDRVLGVIKSCAINHDGKSNGLTAPNGRAQVQLIRKALKRANLDASRIGYIETHGTGTRLGDPIEVHALGDALQRKKRGATAQSPLLLGSVKSNIGHLEAAAGMASLLKTLLIQQNGFIPANLHFSEPNRQIRWDQLDVRVVNSAQPWPQQPQSDLIGISAFGLSGTNVHVIVGPAPDAELQPVSAPQRDAHVFTLSARNADALQAQLQQCRTALEKLDVARFADWCTAHTLHGTHFPLRKALVGGNPEELRLALDIALQAPAMPVHARVDRICFVFTGQGAQYPGMGRELAAQIPAFRQHMDRLAPLFQQILGLPLDELWWGEFSPRLNQTQFTQPALFAFEYCLAQTLMEWGIRPDMCLGHSVGEYVAACIAGVLSLEDALRCIALRARCMAECEAPGVMVAVLAQAERVQDAIQKTASATADKVAIAAYNSPNSTVMSGDRAAVLAVMDHLTEAGVRCVQLDVSHAFHSPLMQPAADALVAQLPTLAVQPGALPVISNVSAGLLDPAQLTPAYLARHIVEPVRFTDSIRFAVEQGANLFIEIGPKSTLTQLLGQIVPDAGIQAFAAIAQARQPIHSLLNCLGKAYEAGLNPAWQAALGGGRLQKVERLTYPFSRQSLWTRSTKRQLVAAPGSSLYRLAWTAVATETTSVEAGDWLLVRADSCESSWLQENLANAGARVQCLTLSDANVADWAAQVKTALQEKNWRGLILQTDALPSLDATTYSRTLKNIERCRLLLEQWEMQCAGENFRGQRGLWLVTPAMHAEISALALAPLQGFVKGASLEKRAAWGGYLELKDDTAASYARAVKALLGDARDLLQVENGVLLQPRLQVVTPPAATELRFSADDAVLIAGGAGGIGLNLCGWCVERGLRRLLVVGRRSAQELGEAAEGLRKLEERGVTVWYRQLDIADSAATAATVAEFESAVGPLTGFIHAAGVASLRNLDQLDETQLRATLDSKLWGAWNLHQLTLDRTVKLFALFSSISSLWGGLQLAHYAAANACLDALTELRLQQGLPVHCIQWGPWKEAGMARDQVSHDMSRMGVRAFDNAAAQKAFFHAVDSAAGIYSAVDADWNALARTFAANPRARLFDDLVVQETSKSAQPSTLPSVQNRAAVDFSNLDATACEARINDIVMTTLTRKLQLERSRIRPETPFMELGLDSILAVEIGRALEAALGMTLPATLLFDAPTAQMLVAALCKRVQPGVRKIATARAGNPQGQDNSLTGLIQMIRQLDDSELDRLLNA